ncbi:MULTISPECIES: zinc-binding alcohol dehydrogenase family protein [Acinetobacter]|jgi:NADPH2:quinone reductase|uniref:Zinc-type alcohol dehydrogenase-like protein n=1 Tax=Acinetobacter johnsonii TaxID=40214 RepID=A0AAJ6IFB2_ACIJO|nr:MULTISPECIES: zinc-binding alcohol dehydrogenase family protein [Acinetobacter]NWK63922.1 zinc-binding alcohol dehydrogenase family protein [Acinetobacter sp. SwsAc3]ALV73185.1 Zn-dependent oxidoreductase [Acinetobacter johnsonii XBB1]MDG9788378.1 zinc-binding alcohol dehydrogenase family protein [Acinetobacter johnsonii]MDG9800764.1 zinc-binding alcohol dehydrogenase family protein [Acinetobacter johnsonii]MDH1242282.1 zinc-binding alcohol dehydrogenase family protein [Acinetobacter johnso
MKAISYIDGMDHGFQNPLVDIEKTMPTLKDRDLLVKVKAISVNPVDTKVRRNPVAVGNTRILGWDAVGEVVEVGSGVQHFKVGDQVWYAGDLTRDGSNAEYQAVDERIVSLKPQSLSDAEAAALPLTAITAWEMLFDRFNVDLDKFDNILVIGGAGGVGSIAIQLLKAKTNLRVIATASREETKAWVKSLGADYVIDHTEDLNTQIKALGLDAPRYIFSTNQTETYLPQISKLIAPQGKFGLIDDPKSLDIVEFKSKSVSVHWEFMFTRSMFNTTDIEQQSQLLHQVAELVDNHRIKTTLNQTLGKINAKNLKLAHELIETGRAKGKIVLEGF